MNLYWCEFDDREWGSYVLAPCRGRAKSLFWEEYNDGWNEYIDIRCQKLKAVSDRYHEKLLDLPDAPELAELGVQYMYKEDVQ